MMLDFYSKETGKRLEAVKAKLNVDENKSSLLVSVKLRVS